VIDQLYSVLELPSGSDGASAIGWSKAGEAYCRFWIRMNERTIFDDGAR
jgi:hypothetical protein